MNEVATKWNELGQKAVTEIIEWTKGAKDFVSEQAPELVREVLAWGFWSHCILVIIFGLLLLASIVGACKLIKGAKKAYDADGWIVGFIFTTLFSIGLTVGVIINLYGCFYITIAPRVYLLKYLGGLVK